jgi:hypothetical protein
MKRREFLLLLSLTCLPQTLPAQEPPAELFARVERAFREQEPDWKIEQTRPSESSDPRGGSITFRSGKGQASVDVRVWRREQDAHDVFEAESRAFDNTGGRRMVKGTIPDLGDENRLWTHPNSEAWPMLRFRKGVVGVVVFAPTLTVAKRFARRVLEQIGRPEN